MPKPTMEQWPDLLRQIAAEVAAVTKKSMKEVLIGSVGSPGLSLMTINNKLPGKGFEKITAADLKGLKTLITELANASEPPRKKAPPKDAYPKPVEFSFRYWFNYFYVELPNPDRKQSYYDQITNVDGSFIAEGALDKKTLLEEMRKEGFEEFAIGKKVSAEALYDFSAKRYPDLQGKGVRVVFRGDGRTPDQIEAHQGTTPQSRLPHLRQKTNMDQDWHPFNTLGNKVFFRKGLNTDNCLFTAISVTPEFYTATKFPLQEELRATNPSALGRAIVLAAPRSGGSTVSRTLHASKSTIYVVKTTEGWNTQERQAALGSGDFPEFASEYIPWEHHLASVPVIRIHYGDDANDGHQIIIERWTWLQYMNVLERLLLDPVSVAQLRDFLVDIYTKGRLPGCGIPYTPPGVAAPDWEIKRVVNAFTPGDVPNLPQPADSQPAPRKQTKLKADTSWIKK